MFCLVCSRHNVDMEAQPKQPGKISGNPNNEERGTVVNGKVRYAWHKKDGIGKGIFNDLKGTLMNLNIINKETILAAHENPERFPDLIVRVTGFSAYFAVLSKEFRQLVVDRIIQGT